MLPRNCCHYCVHEALLSPWVPFFTWAARGSLIKSGWLFYVIKGWQTGIFFCYWTGIWDPFGSWLLALWEPLVLKIHYSEIHKDLITVFKNKLLSAVRNKHIDLIQVNDWSNENKFSTSLSQLHEKSVFQYYLGGIIGLTTDRCAVGNYWVCYRLCLQ